MNLQRKPLEFYNLIKKKVNDEEVFHSFSMDDKMEIATPFYHIVDRHQRYIKVILGYRLL